ncbi:hypothetical protein AVEN_128917-1 [Araneus ventricosus]|uniref:Uncharacterized protein n=1 Tax=Araneus ventricosus TaxID=182803 RepID=A0A4Y2PL55_ARAVE|nr:hypothetical protein AVEN_128917-1 [Araneus ventricosus]
MMRTTSELAPPSPNFRATPTGERSATPYNLTCNRPHTRRIFSGYMNGHYCHNKRSTTLLPACLAVVKHAFQLEGIVPVISGWFQLRILPNNLGCRAVTAVIYVFLLLCFIV